MTDAQRPEVQTGTTDARLGVVPDGPSPESPPPPDPHHGDHADTAVVVAHPTSEPDELVPTAPSALERLEAVVPGGRRPRRRVDVSLLVASFAIAIGVVLVAAGLLRSVTGREQQLLPDAIESIDPIRGATQVPQQTRVFVDFVIGYEATMFIDGVELPTIALDDVTVRPPGLGDDAGDQVEIPPGALWEPGNATLTFEPGPAQVIESFATGMHTVTLRYWRTEDGPARFRTYSWTFYAV